VNHNKDGDTMNRRSISLWATLACAAAIGMPGAQAQTKPWAGVTLNVMTFTGPQIAEPLQRRGKEFEAATGAKVNVITVPYSDLYQKLLTDWSTGTNSIDAAILAPQWMPDYVSFLEDLSPRVKADTKLREDDVAPFFREFSQKYGGKTYTVTLDGDFHIAYYRSDVLAKLGRKPPQTWDEYLDIAKAAHGKDFGDGKPIVGSCIAKKRGAQSFWMITSVAGAFLQAKGTSEGAFFDPATMKPLVNNDAFARALEIYKETGKYGPPNEINMDVGDTRTLFVSGGCALTVDWGDIGPLAVDPKASKVVDKVGALMLPGTTKVLDRASGKLVACDATRCPHAVNGVNRAPFAAFGGWSGAINAKAKPQAKDAAYALFSYMSQPEQSNADVTVGATGFNPYRQSQFKDMGPWKKAGMSDKAAKDYLTAIQDSLNSPNMVLDLRIPFNQRYQQVALDTAMARFLAGELDVKGTMKNIEDTWNELNDELGKAKQQAAYKASIGAK
jgi:multiple sugar transport system substrate-binding protein